MRSGRARAVLVWAIALLAAAGGAVAGVLGLGRAAISAVLGFLEYYSGVFALVGLTVTVVIGLAATGRIVLSVSRRIDAQVVHRSISLAAVALLITHILLKVAEGHASPLDAVAPFAASDRTFYLGAGTLAFDLFVLVTVTGYVRGRFARGAAPGVWRALHVTAYLAWPLSIVHGLDAGRAAAPWVTWSYGACLCAVAAALLVRLGIAARTGWRPRPVPEPVRRPRD